MLELGGEAQRPRKSLQTLERDPARLAQVGLGYSAVDAGQRQPLLEQRRGLAFLVGLGFGLGGVAVAVAAFALELVSRGAAHGVPL